MDSLARNSLAHLCADLETGQLPTEFQHHRTEFGAEAASDRYSNGVKETGPLNVVHQPATNLQAIPNPESDPGEALTP